VSVYFYGVRLHRVSLVARVTARSLHNTMLVCLSPFGEWPWNKVTTLYVVYYARYTRIIHSIQCCNLYIVVCECNEWNQVNIVSFERTMSARSSPLSVPLQLRCRSTVFQHARWPLRSLSHHFLYLRLRHLCFTSSILGLTELLYREWNGSLNFQTNNPIEFRLNVWTCYETLIFEILIL